MGNHARFDEQSENWARKASAVGNVKEVITIKVFIGQIKPSQKSITPIGVSTLLQQRQCVFMHLHAHRRNALKASTISMYTSVATSSIGFATTRCGHLGLCGQGDTTCRFQVQPYEA